MAIFFAVLKPFDSLRFHLSTEQFSPVSWDPVCCRQEPPAVIIMAHGGGWGHALTKVLVTK